MVLNEEHRRIVVRRLQQTFTSNTAKVILALYAWTAWNHLLQVHRCLLVLRKTFPYQSYFKSLRSSWIYATIIFLGDCGNLLMGFVAPKLAIRTVACALRFTTSDYRYGPHERNVLDLYGVCTMPKTLKPVVIFIHGGAWALSSKFHYGGIGDNLERYGILSVIPTYRTFPHGDANEMIEDLESVVKWTISNIAKYGGDPSQMILCGHSSGAHLGALLIVQSALRALESPARDEIVHHTKAFVGLSGPYDIADHYIFESNRYIIPFVKAHSISPLHPSFHGRRRFSTFSPPRLILGDSKLRDILPSFHLFHGINDDVVPFSASQKFGSHLERIGAKIQLVEFPHGHIEILLALMDGYPSMNKKMIQEFLPIVQQTMKRTPSSSSKL